MISHHADAAPGQPDGRESGLALMAVLAAFGVFGAVSALITPGDRSQNGAGHRRIAVVVPTRHCLPDRRGHPRRDRGCRPVHRVRPGEPDGVGDGRRLPDRLRGRLPGRHQPARHRRLQLLGDPDQALLAVDAYDTIWHVGLILFGVHLLLIGALAYRSGFMPKIFGILLVIAGLGYLADGFGAVLVPDYAISIGPFTFVGEVALIFWLLISGSRSDFHRADTHRHPELDPDPTNRHPGGMTPPPVGSADTRRQS